MIHIINTPSQRLELVRETTKLPGASCWEKIKEFSGILRDYNYEKHPFKLKMEGIVRASVNDDENWFNSLDRLSYPNRRKYKKLRIKFGRCNFPDEAVFYCSSENGVPVFEVRPGVGQYIVISTWESKISEKIEFYGAAIGVEAIINSLNIRDTFVETLRQDDVFREETSQEIKEIDRYVAGLFTEKFEGDERLYWLTSAISKIHFDYMVLPDSGQKLQGLVYPSVASQITGANLALSTSFVDENIQLKSASMYKLIQYEEDKMEYVLAPAKTLMRINEKGDLIWQDISQRHAGKYYILSPETPTVPFDESLVLDREE